MECCWDIVQVVYCGIISEIYWWHIVIWNIVVEYPVCWWYNGTWDILVSEVWDFDGILCPGIKWDIKIVY